MGIEPVHVSILEHLSTAATPDDEPRHTPDLPTNVLLHHLLLLHRHLPPLGLAVVLEVA